MAVVCRYHSCQLDTQLYYISLKNLYILYIYKETLRHSDIQVTVFMQTIIEQILVKSLTANKTIHKYFIYMSFRGLMTHSHIGLLILLCFFFKIHINLSKEYLQSFQCCNIIKRDFFFPHIFSLKYVFSLIVVKASCENDQLSKHLKVQKLYNMALLLLSLFNHTFT